MEEDLETPIPTATATQESTLFPDDIDSNCSTPFVSAPSSPNRTQPFSGYYYSAPTSPMHFILTTTTSNLPKSEKPSASTCSFEFDFSAKHKPGGSTSPGEPSMSSADELFFNGQIRPMKLSTHLKRPQVLTPLLDCDEEEEEEDQNDHVGDTCVVSRGRDLKIRDRRRSRSMSPLRNNTSSLFETMAEIETNHDDNEDRNEIPSSSSVITDGSPTRCDSEASSSRSSSVGRNSKRWVFLKEFLYRSKSEGRNNYGHRFWGGLSFSSPVKDKKMEKNEKIEKITNPKDEKKRVMVMNSKALMGKRRVPPSAHELHYTANRAQAEEMRKKTFLPYRQGLLGCLGFSSKSYGAWNGFTRALNPVSSR